MHGWGQRLILLILSASSSGAASCCNSTCIKLALVAEAEALIPDSISYSEKHCCTSCAPADALVLPGRCLEVFGGHTEEHRVVDIWDCSLTQAWMRWRWSNGSTLINDHTHKCLSVYSYDPPRVDQSSECSTHWALNSQRQLVEASSGLCLIGA